MNFGQVLAAGANEEILKSQFQKLAELEARVNALSAQLAGYTKLGIAALIAVALLAILK